MAYIQDGEDKLYEFAAELRHETQNAYLVHDGEKEVWLPKSKTERDGNTYIVPEWLAAEKGLV